MILQFVSWLFWKQQLQASVMVTFEHSTTLDWVGWVLTFGYRNWIIILGVTPPVGISFSHYEALLIGLAKVTCLSASCRAARSKEVSPCVGHLLHVLSYCIGLPIYIKLLGGLSNLFNSCWPVSCQIMEDALMPSFRWVFSYRRKLLI